MFLVNYQAAPHRLHCYLALMVLLVTAPAQHCSAIEVVTFQEEGEARTVSGRVLVRRESGSVLLQSNDGRLWRIGSDTITESRTDEVPFRPVTAKELQKQLEAELPSGFQVYRTPHYLVAYDTSRAFAKWTASLLERLQRALTSYWSRRGVELSEPEFPLVVTIYANRSAFRRAAEAELGTGSTAIGYYSLKTNRVTMFDLTGAEQARGGGGRRASLKEINQMLTTPAALPLVATVVHEATHQVAFNSGLMQRYADLPLWLVEGMAVYFEAPDLSSSRGWRGIGKVNYPRLETFRRNASAWGSASLRMLVSDSRRFRDPRTAVDAYADAWALNYYLIKHRPKEYAKYVQAMAQKPPLEQQMPEQRVRDFEQHFGRLGELQADFLKQMRRVK